jgi:hypothetical protein
MEMPLPYFPDNVTPLVDPEERSSLRDSIKYAAKAEGIGFERSRVEGWTASYQIDSLNDVTCRVLGLFDDETDLPPGVYMTHTQITYEDESGLVVQRLTDYCMPVADEPYVHTETEVASTGDYPSTLDATDESQWGSDDDADWNQLVAERLEHDDLRKAHFFQAFQLFCTFHPGIAVTAEDFPDELE